MQDAGHQLRKARERLHLRYREVEEASQAIANLRGNHEFSIGLSRLADIENKGTVPSLYRLYSLCAIYKLGFSTVLRWYGIHLEELPITAASLPLEATHMLDAQDLNGICVELPADLDEQFDWKKTSYLARHIHRWGKLPLALLGKLDVKNHRYGFIGTEDWSMFPVIRPGSFVQIDESKRRIATEGWTSEHDRPLYFVEHRDGFRCGWCMENNGLLVVMAHSGSQLPPDVFRYPEDADVIGQVVGLAMRLDSGKKRHTRSYADPEWPRNRTRAFASPALGLTPEPSSYKE